MDPMTEPAPIEQLSKQCRTSWPTVAKAREQALRERTGLASKLADAGLFPADTSVVVFGSLARSEWTQGSDLDWTLLVDGHVDSNQPEVARSIARAVAPTSKAPGPTGVFGGLT